MVHIEIPTESQVIFAGIRASLHVSTCVVCLALVLPHAKEVQCGLESLPSLPSQHREQSRALFNPAECTSYIWLPACLTTHPLRPVSLCWHGRFLCASLWLIFHFNPHALSFIWVFAEWMCEFILCFVVGLLPTVAYVLCFWFLIRLHIPWGWLLHQMSKTWGKASKLFANGNEYITVENVCQSGTSIVPLKEYLSFVTYDNMFQWDQWQ